MFFRVQILPTAKFLLSSPREFSKIGMLLFPTPNQIVPKPLTLVTLL